MQQWHELIAQYGYISIIFILGIGIVGLPVPDEVLLTYLGYLTSDGDMYFIPAFLCSLAGAICGISISYILGSKLGEPFLKKYGPKLFIKEETVRKTRKLFGKYGAFVLIFCYFIPGVRHVAAYVAGVTSYSYKRFAAVAYFGAVAWVTAFLVLGNRLGSHWNLIARHLHQYMWGMLLLGVISIGLVFLFKKAALYRRKQT
ncbi:DedA family protein [Aciduricibacillus chroicocephali]|uniref:DedA family protein n=1 Tax=Aciduricibacillus chroicocephali TaxID=3054939 RepID=A0ABY9KVW8_9BACI|nr:DedA family protein [Bacillaceae bacterium 44XB]